jgi:hypothetical protein
MSEESAKELCRSGLRRARYEAWICDEDVCACLPRFTVKGTCNDGRVHRRRRLDESEIRCLVDKGFGLWPQCDELTGAIRMLLLVFKKRILFAGFGPVRNILGVLSYAVPFIHQPTAGALVNPRQTPAAHGHSSGEQSRNHAQVHLTPTPVHQATSRSTNISELAWLGRGGRRVVNRKKVNDKTRAPEERDGNTSQQDSDKERVEAFDASEVQSLATRSPEHVLPHQKVDLPAHDDDSSTSKHDKSTRLHSHSHEDEPVPGGGIANHMNVAHMSHGRHHEKEIPSSQRVRDQTSDAEREKATATSGEERKSSDDNRHSSEEGRENEHDRHSEGEDRGSENETFWGGLKSATGGAAGLGAAYWLRHPVEAYDQASNIGDTVARQFRTAPQTQENVSNKPIRTKLHESKLRLELGADRPSECDMDAAFDWFGKVRSGNVRFVVDMPRLVRAHYEIVNVLAQLLDQRYRDGQRLLLKLVELSDEADLSFEKLHNSLEAAADRRASMIPEANKTKGDLLGSKRNFSEWFRIQTEIVRSSLHSFDSYDHGHLGQQWAVNEMRLGVFGISNHVSTVSSDKVHEYREELRRILERVYLEEVLFFNLICLAKPRGLIRISRTLVASALFLHTANLSLGYWAARLTIESAIHFVNQLYPFSTLLVAVVAQIFGSVDEKSHTRAKSLWTEESLTSMLRDGFAFFLTSDGRGRGREQSMFESIEGLKRKVDTAGSLAHHLGSVFSVFWPVLSMIMGWIGSVPGVRQLCFLAMSRQTLSVDSATPSEQQQYEDSLAASQTDTDAGVTEILADMTYAVVDIFTRHPLMTLLYITGGGLLESTSALAMLRNLGQVISPTDPQVSRKIEAWRQICRAESVDTAEVAQRKHALYAPDNFKVPRKQSSELTPVSTPTDDSSLSDCETSCQLESCMRAEEERYYEAEDFKAEDKDLQIGLPRKKIRWSPRSMRRYLRPFYPKESALVFDSRDDCLYFCQQHRRQLQNTERKWHRLSDWFQSVTDTHDDSESDGKVEEADKQYVKYVRFVPGDDARRGHENVRKWGPWTRPVVGAVHSVSDFARRKASSWVGWVDGARRGLLGKYTSIFGSRAKPATPSVQSEPEDQGGATKGVPSDDQIPKVAVKPLPATHLPNPDAHEDSEKKSSKRDYGPP